MPLGVSAMPGKVQLAIVGSSWWTDSMYLPALAACPEAEVVALTARNEERARSLADSWAIPRVYPDVTELLANEPQLQALVIITPNYTHYDYAQQALEHGLAVLIEKPLTMDYTAALRLADLATEKGVVTLVPFTYRFMPTSRYLKRLIDEGYLGRPFHLNMRYYANYAREGEYIWRFDESLAGSGVLGDLGSHFLYLAEWFYGPIAEIQTMLTQHVPRVPLNEMGEPYPTAEDDAIITCRFANGAQGVIHVSAVCYEDAGMKMQHLFEFHGDGGTLYQATDWVQQQEIRGARVGEGALKPLPIPEDIWAGARQDTVHNSYRDVFRTQGQMVGDFVRAVQNKQRIRPDINDGARVQLLLEAGKLSEKEGRRVHLSELEVNQA